MVILSYFILYISLLFHIYTMWMPPPSVFSYDSENYDSESDSEDGATNSSSSSIVHYDTESDYDSSDEDIFDEIYYSDQDFLDEPKIDQHHYLGCHTSTNCLEITVSPRTFYQYPYALICQYMAFYSVMYRGRPPVVDIIQLHIENDEYHVILKTLWIRLIQRHWKTCFQSRKHAIHLRKQIASQRYFQLHGRYPTGGNRLPSLHGLMSRYTHSSKSQ